MTISARKLLGLSILLLLVSGCSTDANKPPPGGAGGIGGGVTTVSVTASPTTIAASGTSVVTATVTIGGLPVANGIVVTFSLTNGFGTLSAASAITTGGTGTASVTFTGT